MQLNIKAIEKWQTPISTSPPPPPPPFQGYPLFLAKFLVPPPYVTRFFEGHTPLTLIRGGVGRGGGVLKIEVK